MIRIESHVNAVALGALLYLAVACSAVTQADVQKDDSRCPDPKPHPTDVCAQECPPRLAKPGDPPPRWVWADPKRVRDGKIYPCPVCLPEDARIATPTGDVRAADVRDGTIVWSRDAAGRRVAARVVLVGATAAGPEHRMVRVVLADGRAVAASPGHPVANGVLLEAIARGDSVDGSRAIQVERRPFDGSRTVDLLPDSATGIYWADGVPLRSTLLAPR